MTLKVDTETALMRFLGEWREALSEHELADQRRESAAELRHVELLSTMRATTIRIDDLEERADAHSDRAAATGEHERVQLRASIDAWKTWARGIVATLLTSAITGLVVYWATHR